MHVYSLGSPFGVNPCEALARCKKGFAHHKTANEEHRGDPVAVWGQLRGAKQILSKSKDFYRLDHAYYKRMDYFRMTRGDFQPSSIKERPSDRWDKVRWDYKIGINPWKRGRNIILALSDPRTYDFFGQVGFPAKTRDEIAKHTDRPIIDRKREEKIPLGEQLKDAWCLVTYASNSVIDALLSGVPVFTLGPSIARPMGLSDLTKIEAPLYPENREEFFRHMAYCQYTLDEFRNGFALRTADENWDSATSS